METLYQCSRIRTLKHYLEIENLQLVRRLLVTVDEAEPHGGGVRVEKLQLGGEVVGKLTGRETQALIKQSFGRHCTLFCKN